MPEAVTLEGMAVAFEPVLALNPAGARLFGVEGVACLPEAPPACALPLAVAAGDELFADRPRCATLVEAAAGLPAGLRLFLPVHAATLAGDRGFARALLRVAARSGIAFERLTIDVVEEPGMAPRSSLAGLEELRWLGLGVAARATRLAEVEAVLHWRRPDYLRLDVSLLAAPDGGPAPFAARLVERVEALGARVMVDDLGTAGLGWAGTLGVGLVAAGRCWRLVETPSDLLESSWCEAAGAAVARKGSDPCGGLTLRCRP